MKTVAASLRGVDHDLKPTGDQESRDLGRANADICVRYLLGLPEEVLLADEDHIPPTLRLKGRRGMWLELSRRETGRSFFLTMKDGEQDYRIDEILATRRVRLFVEHWGDETDLTAEFRLPPEVRAEIEAREGVVDEARRKRLEEGPPRVAFTKRRGLVLRKHEVVVDREKGMVTEGVGNRVDAVGPLSAMKRADVRGLDGDRPCLEVVLIVEDRETTRPIGDGIWTKEETMRMAECINDAIGLPESRRKILRYRRAAR